MKEERYRGAQGRKFLHRAADGGVDGWGHGDIEDVFSPLQLGDVISPQQPGDVTSPDPPLVRSKVPRARTHTSGLLLFVSVFVFVRMCVRVRVHGTSDGQTLALRGVPRTRLVGPVLAGFSRPGCALGRVRDERYGRIARIASVSFITHGVSRPGRALGRVCARV